MKHWRLMIPLVALALAMLACDHPTVIPAGVLRVYADAEQPAIAYAEVQSRGIIRFEGMIDDAEYQVYRTDDYGETWQRSDTQFPEIQSESLPLRVGRTDLRYEQQVLWSIPQRETFRFVFLNDALDRTSPQPFWALRGVITPSNSLAGDILYVAMGSQGILVLPAPGSAASFEPRLSAEGIDLMQPVLTINDPFKVSSIILLGLLVPPLPLIHAYLLSRVWRYVAPTQAFRWALVTSGGLAVCAAFAINAWVTNIQIEFEPMVVVMTLLCVAFGVIGALLLPGKRKFHFRLLIVLGSALVSLPVPFAVSTLYWGWYLVVAGLCGYYLLRRSIIGSLSVNDIHAEWLLDRGAIELIVIGLLAGYVFHITNISFSATSWFVLLFAGFAALFIWRWYAWSQRISDKPRSAWRPLAFLGVWIVISLVASGGLYFVQMYALSWFNSLIK